MNHCVAWLGMPIRLFLSIRRSMTGASASLLIILIVSLNIVWGYPWTGVFSASLAMLGVVYFVNRLLAPRLQIEASPPDHSPVGEPFDVALHLHQHGRLPTFDLQLRFANSRKGKDAFTRKKEEVELIETLGPGEYASATLTLKGTRRGIHDLPKVEVRSPFPFHVFEGQQSFACDTQIAITPAPLDQSQEDRAQVFIDQVSGWTQRQLSGESFDYVGNREYEVGMPVRRWDFRSWARLGRPIVQEFQTPSLRMITILLDASMGSKPVTAQTVDDFEVMLQWVATAIHHWNRLSVSTRMYVSSEPVEDFLAQQTSGAPELTSLLVQLATIEPITPAESDQRMARVLHEVGAPSAMVFSLRNDIGDTPGETSVFEGVSRVHFDDLSKEMQETAS